MTLTASIIAARVGLAALLGLLIGIDREHLRKPAGMRTMLMVSFGACLFTLGGIHLATMGQIGSGETPTELIPSQTINARPINADALSRVIQGVVGGIGFLGAGVIIRDRGHVRGVTTAAGLWVTAGVGIACGLGEYLLACLAAVLAIVAFTSSRFLIREDANSDHDEEDSDDAPSVAG